MSLWGELATTLASELQVIAFDPRGVGWSATYPGFTPPARWPGTRAAYSIRWASRRATSLGSPRAPWWPRGSRSTHDRGRGPRPGLAPAPAGGAVASIQVPRLSSPALLARPGVEVEVGLVDDILSSGASDRASGANLGNGAARLRPPRARGVTCCCRPWRRRSTREKRSWSGCPNRTLLLFGELDPIVGLASRAELMRVLPKPSSRCPRAGHDLSLERPRELGETVLKFLAH